MIAFESAFEIARQEARRLGEVHSRGASPVDLKQMCRDVGITNISEKAMLATGLLVSVDAARWHIFLKEGLPSARRNFTIAHEIGHILLSQANGVSKPKYSRGGSREYTQEERAADRLAGELLIPRALLEKQLRAGTKNGHSVWQQVYGLSALFGVSVSAMIFRILECESLAVVLGRCDIVELSNIQPRFVVDCSKHAFIRFFEYPSNVLSTAAHDSVVRGTSTIGVEVLGKPVEIIVGSCKRQVRRNKPILEQWILGWHWLS